MYSRLGFQETTMNIHFLTPCIVTNIPHYTELAPSALDAFLPRTLTLQNQTHLVTLFFVGVGWVFLTARKNGNPQKTKNNNDMKHQ